MGFTPSGPSGKQSEEKHFQDQNLQSRQLEGFKVGSGEGHADQRKVPLRKNPGPLGTLPVTGGEQSGESRVMAHIPDAWDVGHIGWKRLSNLPLCLEQVACPGRGR